MVVQENKDKIVIEELADVAPLIILVAQKKQGPVVLFATKSSDNKQKWVPITVGVEDDWSSTIGGTSSRHRVSAGLMVGLGNYAEFQTLISVFRTLLSDELNTYGEYENVHATVLKSFACYMNENFRSAKTSIPYRVELGIVSLLGAGTIEIFRVKADGDFHRATPFCILGGYRKMENGKSVRSKALELAQATYREKLPTLSEARKLIKQILALDPSHGVCEEGFLAFHKA